MSKPTSIHAASLITESDRQDYYKEPGNNFINLEKNRTFTNYQKKEILYQQNGKCAGTLCKHKNLDPNKIQFEHKKPWTYKGRIVMQYGRAVCIECSLAKTDTKKTKIAKKNKTKKAMLFF